MSAVEPGIYFGMPADDYHAIPALSATGIKWLNVSIEDFYARTTWLNPDAEPEAETDAMELGTAYHCRIVEGRDVFRARYAQAFDPAAHPGALDTVEEIKAALRERGEKLGGDKAALIARLAACAPEIDVTDALRSAYESAHPGKEFLSPRAIRRIEFAAAMIEMNPDTSKCFLGGYPETVIVWMDPTHKVLKKMRADYLKPAAIPDLKTFSNNRRLKIETAIYMAIANQKYMVQAAHYIAGAAAAVDLIREGRIFGPRPPTEWLDAYVNAAERVFVFVFFQTGIAPLARSFKVEEGAFLSNARMVVDAATQTFARCLAHFDPGMPWVEPVPMKSTDDMAFLPWTND